MNKPTILRLIKYLSISFLSLVIAAIVLGGGVFFYYVSKAPSLSESKLVATTSSKIYDNKNQLIADLGSERRVNAQANDIPTDLVKAIVSIEDHRFFDHPYPGSFLAQSAKQFPPRWINSHPTVD